MQKLLSFFLIVLFSNLTIAQTTAIPDTVFEQNLINLGYDNVLDGVVLTANIDTVTQLTIMFQNIFDLTGIEDFNALSNLNCQWNQLSTLDLSQNIALTYLNCVGNQLTSLEFTQNPALNFLWCSSNQLINLDVTQNSALATLYCTSNQLNSLNLSQNTLLSTFSCWNNNLNCLNLKNGNNPILTNFDARGNPNLTCIQVDNIAWSTANWTTTNSNIDSGVVFNTNCGNPCAVRIDEIILSELSIFPNPTTGNISIDLGTVKQNLKATLINNLGQIILIKKIESTALFDITIDAPKGIYFLQLETTKGEIKTLKVIKE